MKIDTLNKIVLVGLVSILVISFLSWAIVAGIKFDRQEDDFIKREIGGILDNVKKEDKGVYALEITQHMTKEKLEYHLYLSPFMTDNSIQASDSISKNANGHIINFFKKRDGTFYKCCELYYY